MKSKKLILIVKLLTIDKRDDTPKFKILLIGPAGTPRILVGVGKISLLVKYIHNKFSYDYQS